MVPPEIPLFPFHPSLLVAAGGIAELCLIAPVRSERHKPLRLLALIPPQNLLHRAAQIVIPQPLEYPTKVGEGQLVRFQESLLCGARVGNVKRPSAEHAPHAEHLLHLLAFPQIRHRFIPIHLGFHSGLVGLRNKDLPAAQQSQLLLVRSHVAPMKSLAGPRLGLSRSTFFRSRGTALSTASRTILRCTPNFCATPWIVPTPCSYSRLICSNSSTFVILLFNQVSPPGRCPKQNSWPSFYRVGQIR